MSPALKGALGLLAAIGGILLLYAVLDGFVEIALTTGGTLQRDMASQYAGGVK